MAQEITAKSKGGLFPHTHTLTIPKSVIDQIKDVTLTTSDEYSLIFKHHHEVTLSKDNLEKIKAGQEVVVYDNDKRRHSFAIKA